MEISNRKVLIGIIALSLLLFPAATFTSGALRTALSLPFVLFFPGYTLLSSLFPRRDSLSGIARIAFSIGLSLAVTSLTGLILNYTPWGIKLYPTLTSVTVFIIATSGVAWYREHRLQTGERFSITLKLNLPQWQKTGNLDKALSISLAVAILVALGSLGYVVATPKEGNHFSEFYILNIEGKAENYPSQVTLGEPVELIIGVVNHEYKTTSYRIELKIDGSRVKEINIDSLAQEEKWEQVVTFTPQSTGQNQKVTFWLYKDNASEPYFKDPLHLYLNVASPPLNGISSQ